MAYTAQDYRDWIRNHAHEGYEFVEDDPDHFRLVCDWATGEITFYVIDDTDEIVQFQLVDPKTEEVSFFLHFQVNDQAHVQGLFEELVEALFALKGRQKTRVLLSCTSALTTNFFAQKLNELAEGLSLQYEFAAVSYDRLAEVGGDYDAILLAPQIGYLYDRLVEVLKDSLVLRLPATIFGAYDAAACFDFVHDALREQEARRREEAEAIAFRDARRNRTLLAISVFRDQLSTRIRYRVYNKDGIVFDETAVHKFPTQQANRIDEKDIENVIHYVWCVKGFKPDLIGVSVPGVVNDGKVYLRGVERETDFKKAIEDRFSVPVKVINNANAAALGWYSQQDTYKHVTLHSQPRGGVAGGQGMVSDGHVVLGHHNAAGEVHSLLRMFFPEEMSSLEIWDLDRARDIVVTELLANIAVFAPEVIVVRSVFTPDMDELRAELAKYVPDHLLPDLVYTENFEDYALHGAMLLADCDKI